MAAKPQEPEANEASAAEGRLAEAVDRTFAGKCKAAWLSGSYAYQGARLGRSDIDVVLVLDKSVPVPADAATLALVRGFVDEYLAVHALHGLDPDLDFPGEYVAAGSIDQAIEWRGFAYEGAVPDQFPPVETEDYWIARPDRWHHAWVSMTAFSRLLAGSAAYHRAMKLAAWKAIARFLLLRSDGLLMSVDDLLPRLAQFGLKPSYRGFWPVERDWARRALEALETEGAVNLSDGLIVPNATFLDEWQRQLSARIANGDAPALLLPPDLHSDVGRYAARRWTELSGET